MPRQRTVTVTLPPVAFVSKGHNEPRMWGTADRQGDWAVERLLAKLVNLPAGTRSAEAEKFADRELAWIFRDHSEPDEYACDTIKSVLWERRQWRLWGYRPIDEEDRLIPLGQLPPL